VIHYTRLERLERCKHSNFLVPFVSDKEKKSFEYIKVSRGFECLVELATKASPFTTSPPKTVLILPFRVGFLVLSMEAFLKGKAQYNWPPH
jgi:hypothetical protein